MIVAFLLVSLLQAGLFTALSDQLLRDGIDGEATARLDLVARLLPRAAPAKDWPLEAVPAAAKGAWRLALQDYADRYGLARASLLLPQQALDSQDADPALKSAQDWAVSDGLRLPTLRGEARISGRLFKSEDGWRKVLYAPLDRDGTAWLRLEAGTPFLGQVAALQRRLLRLSAFLALPALLLGLGLGWLLSRRARALERRLAAPEDGVRLGGRDEFARISAKVQELLDALARQRSRADALASARLRLAQDLSLGVAHELRNPLASLSLLADVLERRRLEGAPAQELAELGARFQAEVARLGDTVARFMEFSRSPELSPEPLDLAALLAGLGAEELDLSGEARAWADRKAVELIVRVLLGNGREAAGPGARLRATLSQPPEAAVLQVWDPGPPIEAGLRDRLFTPFFTTKSKGLGLGLATAASLADHLGGRLRLLEDGKTFELSLPAASGRPDGAPLHEV